MHMENSLGVFSRHVVSAGLYKVDQCLFFLELEAMGEYKAALHAGDKQAQKASVSVLACRRQQVSEWTTSRHVDNVCVWISARGRRATLCPQG